MTSPHQSPQLAAMTPADMPHAGAYTAEQIAEIIRRVHAWIKAGRGRSRSRSPGARASAARR